MKVFALFAALAVGQVLPLNSRMSPEEIKDVLENAFKKVFEAKAEAAKARLRAEGLRLENPEGSAKFNYARTEEQNAVRYEYMATQFQKAAERMHKDAQVFLHDKLIISDNQEQEENDSAKDLAQTLVNTRYSGLPPAPTPAAETATLANRPMASILSPAGNTEALSLENEPLEPIEIVDEALARSRLEYQALQGDGVPPPMYQEGVGYSGPKINPYAPAPPVPAPPARPASQMQDQERAHRYGGNEEETEKDVMAVEEDAVAEETAAPETETTIKPKNKYEEMKGIPLKVKLNDEDMNLSVDLVIDTESNNIVHVRAKNEDNGLIYGFAPAQFEELVEHNTDFQGIFSARVIALQ